MGNYGENENSFKPTHWLEVKAICFRVLIRRTCTKPQSLDKSLTHGHLFGYNLHFHWSVVHGLL